MSRRPLVALVLALLAMLVAPGSALAEDYRISISRLDPSAFPTVKITASVTDPQGRPVKGLKPTDLIILENGVAQQATVDLSAQSAPVALALVLDTSGSMAGRPIADAKAAVVSMIRSLGPTDTAAFVSFSDTPNVAQQLTTDKDAVVRAANGAAAAGNTAIWDAVITTSDVLARAAPSARRATLLLTDGADTASRATLNDAVARVKAANNPLYVIALGDEPDLGALGTLANAAPGGQLLRAPTSAQLADIYSKLSEQILSQYTIQYRSSNAQAQDGAQLKLQLQLVQGGGIAATADSTYNVPAGRPAQSSGAPGTAAPLQQLPAPVAAVEPYLLAYRPALVAGLGFLAALFIFAAVISVTSRGGARRERRRLTSFVVGASAAHTPEHEQQRSFTDRVVVPTLSAVSRPFLRFAPTRQVSSMGESLLQAGQPLGMGPAEFIGLRIALAIALAAGGLLLAAPLGAEFTFAVLLILFGLLLGYLIPGIIVGQIARSRKHKIQRALPSALDMLTLSAEAGLTLDGGLAQIANRSEGPLAEEFRLLLVELQMGMDRRQAMRELGRRTGLPEVVSFANAIVQADALGVPVGKVLLEQATEMRTKRRQRAEELARQAPVKMLFPMILFIFPALFLIILGPAAYRLSHMFNAVGP